MHTIQHFNQCLIREMSGNQKSLPSRKALGTHSIPDKRLFGFLSKRGKCQVVWLGPVENTPLSLISLAAPWLCVRVGVFMGIHVSTCVIIISV